jgi:menaquinone-dependent protoporphyrinogen oxidase
MRVLVSYASRHGSTREVAEVVGRALRGAGMEVDVCSSGDVDLNEDVGAVILGSAIYMGSWLREAEDFATRNAAALQALPVWLFSVGPLGEPVDDAEEQPRQLAMLRDTLGPREHVLFHGRLDPAAGGGGPRGGG